jgi:very-short-patch-repair endonuclease
MSKGETNIMEWLKQHNIEFNHQYKFDNCRNPKTNKMLKYDFYIPHNNLLIEFDGQQHYRIGCKVRNHILTQEEIANIKFRDQVKTDYATTKGINLLRIPYTEINHINNILQKEIYGKK